MVMPASRSVILTGVSGGIGRAISSRLMASGWIVAGIDTVNPESPLEHFLPMDLADIAKPDEQAALQAFLGKVDAQAPITALVNNAAVQELGTFDEVSAEMLNRSFAVNVTAPFVLAQCLHDRLARHQGSIINIGSIHGEQTKKGFLPYSVSKSALRGLTRALAIELGQSIKVNSIEPAAIATEMLKQGFENHPGKLKDLSALHPTGRIGTPQDIAELVRYLIEDAPAFLNGSIIGVDGGISSVLHDPQSL